MNMEVIVSFVDRLSGPAREAAESLNKIKTSAEGLGRIGEHFTSATNGMRGAGTIFKNAGEGASQLAPHLRALEGINVAPKLVAIGNAATDMKDAGGIFRSAGKGAEQLATGIKALEGLDASKVTAIADAMGKMRASGSGGEGALAGDMKTFATEAVKGAGAAERIEKALGGAAAHLSTLTANPALTALGGLANGPGAPFRTRPGATPHGEQVGPAAIEAPAPIRAPENAMTAPAIRLPTRPQVTGAAGHHTFLDDMKKAHHRHLTNELGGAVQLGVQPLIISELAKSVFEQGAELDKELAIGKANGLPDDVVQGVLKHAQNVAHNIPQTDIAGNFKALMALRMATGGNLDEAQHIFEKVAKAGVYVGSMTGKKQTGDTFAEAAYDMVRTGELKGDITDPKKFDGLIESIARTTIYSEGKVTPQSYHATAVYLRGALQGLSDEFFNNKLPFLAQELASHGVAGSQAGSAIAQVSQVVGNSGVFSKNVENWIKFGLADPSKVTDRGTGKAKFQPDALYSRDMERRDPQEYAAWVKKKIEEHGYTTKDQQIDALNMLSGNLKFKQAMEIMMFQDERMSAFSRTQGKVLGVDQGYDVFNNTMSGSMAGVVGRYRSAQQTAGDSAAPVIVPALKGISAIIDRFNTDIGGGGDEQARPLQAVKDISAAARAVTLFGNAPGIRQLLAGSTALASKLPMFGPVIGEAAPIFGRFALGANPYLSSIYAASTLYSSATTPNKAAADSLAAADQSGGLEAMRRQLISPGASGPLPVRIVGADETAKLANTPWYDKPTPEMMKKADGLSYAYPMMSTAMIAAFLNKEQQGPRLPPSIKSPDPVKLPDATAAGAQAGNQIAAGVTAQSGAVAAAAEALMAKIRAVLGGGVDVPVHLQSPGVPGSGAAPAAGPEKHASLTPAVRASVVAQHVASVDNSRVVNDHRKTNVSVHVASNDPKAVVKAVQDHFKNSALAQLSDGVFS